VILSTAVTLCYASKIFYWFETKQMMRITTFVKTGQLIVINQQTSLRRNVNNRYFLSTIEGGDCCIALETKRIAWRPLEHPEFYDNLIKIAHPIQGVGLVSIEAIRKRRLK
jgi:hypothetical protein